MLNAKTVKHGHIRGFVTDIHDEQPTCGGVCYAVLIITPWASGAKWSGHFVN
jgi:hypothetical protein